MPTYDHEKDEHYLVRGQRGYQCACKLCHCGNHSCPRQMPKSDFTTSYQQQYQGFSVQPIHERKRCQYQQRHYNPEVLKSNYKEEYLPFRVEEQTQSVTRMGSIGRQILKSEPFVAATAYSQQYKPYKIQNIQPQSVFNSRLQDSRSSVKFQGESSYKSQFHSMPMPKIDRYKHPQYKNNRPFQGISSYQNDYPSFKIENVIFSPKLQSNRKQVKFEGSSTYNNHYGSFKVAPIYEKEYGQQGDYGLEQSRGNYLSGSNNLNRNSYTSKQY